MNEFQAYGNQAGSTIATVMQDSAGLATASSLITDSLSFEADSLLRTPSDSLFRFFEIKPEAKLFIGDARFPSDTAYVERILWDGLTVRFREKQNISNDWLTIVLFFVLLLFASARAGFPKYINTMFHSLVSYTASARMYREKNYSFLHAAFRLEIMFYIIFSVFVFQIIGLISEGNTFNYFIEFAKISGFLVVYFVVKKQLYKLLGWLFIGASDTSEIIFNIDNFNRATGLILFPIVALIAFNPYGSSVFAASAGIFTVLVLYLMMLQRGISILLKKQVSIFYLFLYLCTLEFLPLLLMYKIAVG